MRAQAIESVAKWPPDITPPRGELVLSGYGLEVGVWRGRLRIADGAGRQRRSAIIHRAAGGLRRLIILGHSGVITLEAIRWLADVGVGYVQIDGDGRVLAAFGPHGVDQPALRRAQALAPTNDIGLNVTRTLLHRKISGQNRSLDALRLAVDLPETVEETLHGSLARLEQASDSDTMRALEAKAASSYWSAWSALIVRFSARDTERVPAHWRTFGSRSSVITGQPRAATNPANAMLNYLYALLESEVVLASRIVGLDPGLGIFHVDTPHRSSFASDVMEPLRPEVDRYLLGLLTSRVFGARDFFETRTGVCRVVSPLTQELADTIRHWERFALPLAQEVAGLLVGGSDRARAYRRPRKASAPLAAEKRSPTTTTPRVRTPRPRCAVCGKPVRRRADRTCSAECERLARVAAGHTGGTRLKEIQQALRAEGRDPAATPEARAKLRASNARRQAERRAWELEHPGRPDPEVYHRDVFPAVQKMSLRGMRRATGLSLAHCARIRRGDLVPHPRWWEALRKTAGRPQMTIES